MSGPVHVSEALGASDPRYRRNTQSAVPQAKEPLALDKQGRFSLTPAPGVAVPAVVPAFSVQKLAADQLPDVVAVGVKVNELIDWLTAAQLPGAVQVLAALRASLVDGGVVER